ncbi:hypothetical protein K458DRAFT_204918 [Lentithecium fluviatile CBS 122367]|uniref:Uncharacterized protein n=1 Tax=Lentithecium fluviatile CBS 122367 TaxID=1168545 RepID=A0A6G1JA01_9PLEO|nr:hypothetical protein K458DRAFT_204918 [Lentithecium fluviatile CBS 122367]
MTGRGPVLYPLFGLFPFLFLLGTSSSVPTIPLEAIEQIEWSLIGIPNHFGTRSSRRRLFRGSRRLFPLLLQS